VTTSLMQTVTVDVIRQGRTTTITDLVDAGVITGSVRIDTKATTRRSCELNVADRSGALVPGDIGDLLAPPCDVRIAMSMGGNPVELGTFGISRPEVSDTPSDLTLRVDGYDHSRKVRRNRWVVPYNITSGTPLDEALQDAISSRYPLARFNFANVSTTLPAVSWGLEVDNDPWADMVKLAHDYNYQLFVDAGAIFTLRPIPNAMTSTVTHTFIEGENCTMTSVARSFDDEPGYNGVVGRAEGDHLATPLRSEVWDDDPTSPTYYLGDWGKVPRFFTTGILTTQGQLDEAVETLLREELRTEQSATVTAIADPTVDADEVVVVERSRSKVRGRWQVQSVTLPLGGAAMTLSLVARKPPA
jgi:hypothetical protein